MVVVVVRVMVRVGVRVWARVRIRIRGVRARLEVRFRVVVWVTSSIERLIWCIPCGLVACTRVTITVTVMLGVMVKFKVRVGVGDRDRPVIRPTARASAQG